MSPPPNQTRVIVLAAGRGSRLGTVGSETPKWLLEVGGRTIAERQLEAAAQARSRGTAVLGPVEVVTGHAETEIRRFLEVHSPEPVSTLHNVHFSDLNNWYSVLLALRGAGPDERIVIVNADLYAEADWIAEFLTEAASTESDALVAVDVSRELTSESMKVAATGSPSRVAAIGKVGVDEPIGEYVGMLMAGGEVLSRFRETLESFVGVPDRRDEWYERAVGLTAAEGVPWLVWPTPSGAWVEIDDDADLQRAESLASGVPA